MPRVYFIYAAAVDAAFERPNNRRIGVRAGVQNFHPPESMQGPDAHAKAIQQWPSPHFGL